MTWDALDLALALHAAPQRIGEVRQRPLPTGISSLLRLALAHAETVAQAVSATAQPAQVLVEAARFFIEQLMLCRECEADPWRVLGVVPGAAREQIREHHQLLVRLVHPDRSDDWATAYADRVNKAWRQLRDDDERAALLERASLAAGDAVARMDASDAWQAHPPRPVRTGPAMRAPIDSVAPPPRASFLRVSGIVTSGVLALAVTFWLGYRGGLDPTPDPTSGDRSEPVAAVFDTPAIAEAPGVSQPAATTVIEPANVTPEPMAIVVPEHRSPPAPAPPAAAVQTGPATISRVPTTKRHEPTATQTTSSPLIATNKRAPPSTVPVPAASVAQPGVVAASSHEPTAMPVAAAEPAPPNPPVLATTTTDADVPIADPAPGRDDTMALLDRYAVSYALGDLNGLLELFAREVHNDPRSVALIAGEYSRLFGSTNNREIRLHDLRWRNVGDRVAGEARFEASYQRNGRNRRHTVSGRIAFELIHDAGQSRLLRLVSRDDGGS